MVRLDGGRVGDASKEAVSGVRAWSVSYDDQAACTEGHCDIRLAPQRCSVFRVDVGWKGNKYNNGDAFGGRVTLKCGLEDGRVSAKLEFPACV